MIRSPLFLLADDNPDDAELTREALREAEPRVRLEWVRDGQECIDYLNRGAQRPDLVLLDLNMPRKDGRQTLQEIKENPDLCDIPVVVLTTSEAERDVLESYRRHANAYMVKPITIDDLIDIMKQLSQFWLGSFLRLPQSK